MGDHGVEAGFFFETTHVFLAQDEMWGLWGPDAGGTLGREFNLLRCQVGAVRSGAQAPGGSFAVPSCPKVARCQVGLVRIGAKARSRDPLCAHVGAATRCQVGLVRIGAKAQSCDPLCAHVGARWQAEGGGRGPRRPRTVVGWSVVL